MKIHKDIKIEAVASTDKTRQALLEPYLDIKDGKGTLVATDGKALACIPVEVASTDVSGFVSAAVLKAARKAAKRSEVAEIGLNGHASIADGSTMPRDGQAKGAYPDWLQIIPYVCTKPAATIEIDAQRLWQLAQAMGSRTLRLVIEAEGKPIAVLPSMGRSIPACKGSRGVIMATISLTP